MSILFINGSPNKNGNTKSLATALLGNKEYTQLDLVDYKIYSYGQNFADDQFDDIVDAMKKASTIVIGSPVYWHSVAGALRNLLDRFYGPVPMSSFKGHKLFFLFQGAGPEPWMLEKGDYTMSRFASLYGFNYMGMATTAKEAKQLASKL